MSIFDLKNDEEKHEPEVCMALIANGDHGGCILECKGTAIQEEIQQCGQDLGNLGLDDAPDGLSIWEGSYIGVKVGTGDYGYEWESQPKGTFRQLTGIEWDQLKTSGMLWP